MFGSGLCYTSCAMSAADCDCSSFDSWQRSVLYLSIAGKLPANCGKECPESNDVKRGIAAPQAPTILSKIFPGCRLNRATALYDQEAHPNFRMHVRREFASYSQSLRLHTLCTTPLARARGEMPISSGRRRYPRRAECPRSVFALYLSG